MEHARPLTRRRETCPFTGPNAPKIDKDSKLLMRYVSERGKIVPSRASGPRPPRKHCELARAVKRSLAFPRSDSPPIHNPAASIGSREKGGYTRNREQGT